MMLSFVVRKLIKIHLDPKNNDGRFSPHNIHILCEKNSHSQLEKYIFFK